MFRNGRTAIEACRRIRDPARATGRVALSGRPAPEPRPSVDLAARRPGRGPTGTAARGSSRGSAPRDRRARATRAVPGGGASRRLLLQDRHHGLDVAVPPEGALARQHLVEDQRRSEKMSERWSSAAPADLLGRHVADRAEDLPRARLPASGGCRRSLSGRVERPTDFARPKSRILTRPSRVTKTFWGFRSRWTMPRSCAAASPWTICSA